MKVRSLALILICFIAVALRAQQTAPPDILTPQTAASMAFMAYKSWAESQISGLWNGLTQQQTLTANLPQDRANIATLQQQVQDLQDQITALKTLPATPIIMHFDAESTTTAGVTVKPILAAPGGNKITLLAGQRLTYNLLVPATKSYTFSGFIGSDSSTQGSITFHLETATANSGPMTAPGGGAWVASTTSQPMALTAGPVALTVVIDSPSITGGAFYADYFEGSAKQ